MAGKPKARRWATPVADLATDILDPLMRKRAGMSVALIQSWEEIVGTRLAAASRPQKIQWPRRRHEDDPFEPATLVVACEGMAALALQHETGEVISRVNAFLGFAAIGRIRIVQKPVAHPAERQRPREPRLDEGEKRRLADLTGGVEDEGLRASLDRLGAHVVARRRP